jgi:hypothetical protein
MTRRRTCAAEAEICMLRVPPERTSPEKEVPPPSQ